MGMGQRIEVANELDKMTGVGEDKADRIVNAFIEGTNELSKMREYWNAKSAKDAAKVVKKYWL
jgi:hypothetical protein